MSGPTDFVSNRFRVIIFTGSVSFEAPNYSRMLVETMSLGVSLAYYSRNDRDITEHTDLYEKKLTPRDIVINAGTYYGRSRRASVYVPNER